MQIVGEILKVILRNKNHSLGKEYATNKVISDVSKAFGTIVHNFAEGRKYISIMP